MFGEKIAIHISHMRDNNNARGRGNADSIQIDKTEPSATATDQKEYIMASNKALVPEAKEALDRFKMEAAAEVGVNLNQGYNGELTARQAGSIGGQMVKKMTPIRSTRFLRANRTKAEHCAKIMYIVSVVG